MCEAGSTRTNRPAVYAIVCGVCSRVVAAQAAQLGAQAAGAEAEQEGGSISKGTRQNAEKRREGSRTDGAAGC
jgi:hypothetical protein